MAIIRRLLKITTLGTVGAAATFAFATRQSKFVPFPVSDPLLTSAAFQRQNPNRNPATQDLCIRRVALSSIKPSLLEKQDEGALAEAFCAGVWSGLGYRYQRRYLSKKYQNDTTTAHQLWSVAQLRESRYDVGTQITDHFEVVEKDTERVVVRCGDSPLKTEVRDSDGLFEMGAKVLKDEGVVEFSLKSVFFKGLGRSETKPMPPHVEFAHRLYTKVWMESAIRNVVR